MNGDFYKDPQNPRDGTGFGIKHLSGSMTIGGGSSNIDGGSGVSDPHNPRIPVFWKDGSAWFADDMMGRIILKVGGESGDDGGGWVIKAEKQIDISGEGGYINDGSGWVIEDPTDTISGDDQYDASGVWDKHGSTEYGGRTSEDISGGEGLDHEWWRNGDFYIVDPTSWIDPTWVSGHTNSFLGGDSEGY